MKKVTLILLITLLYSCTVNNTNVAIPYNKNVFFYDSAILPPEFIEYIKKNNISSIDLLYNDKVTKDFIVFNEDGIPVSRKYFKSQDTSVYTYESGKLIEITNPGRIFKLSEPEKITFKYKGNRVSEALAITRGNVDGKVLFTYFSDSIYVRAYQSNVTPPITESPVQTSIYKFSNSDLIFESQTNDDKLLFTIDKKKINDTLSIQNWKFQQVNKKIDSINANGMIASSTYFYTKDNWERTTFTYSENKIEQHMYSHDGKLTGLITLILHKK